MANPQGLECFRDLIPVRCGKSTGFGMLRDLIPVRCGKSTGFGMFRDLIPVRMWQIHRVWNV